MASAAACSDEQTAKSGREGRGSGCLVGKHVGSQDLSFSGTRPKDHEAPAEMPAVDGLRSFAAASGAIGKAVGYDPRDRSGRNARQSCRRGGDYLEVDEEEAVEVLVGLVAAAASAAASADHEVMGSTLGPGVGSAKPQVAARYAIQEMVAAAAAAPWWRSRDKRAVALPAIKYRPPPLFGRDDEGMFIGRGDGHTHSVTSVDGDIGSVTSVDGVGQQGRKAGQEPLLVEHPPVAAPPPSPAAGVSPGFLSSSLAPPLEGSWREAGGGCSEPAAGSGPSHRSTPGELACWPADGGNGGAGEASGWSAAAGNEVGHEAELARLYPAGYPSISAMIAHEALTDDGDMRPCLTIPSNAARTREEALVGGSDEDSDSGSYSTMVGSERALLPDAVTGTDLSIGKRSAGAPPAVSPRVPGPDAARHNPLLVEGGTA
ncbi:hypothetical protein HaLaN_14132 [Haematococcus lacustris]|uniref:Uncharacterized protein n=1 Tax=Haematococcus lacustris TaxID=44745 RepID=A0A699Z4J0_HAELA|nr:hypothetical protein HaLaN_14132 [Haematococcus lacustris]